MRRLIAILLSAYAMHFAWEMAHASLFAPMDRLPFWQATGLVREGRGLGRRDQRRRIPRGGAGG